MAPKRRIKKVIRLIIKNTWFKTSFIESKHKKYREYMKSRYNYDNNPSIISSNCIGGIIYNTLGLRFLSPTINVFIPSKDFIKIINDLENYLTNDLIYKETSMGGYPIGILKDITIHFNHYKTFEEARIKWNERVKRIDFNNLYIMLHDRNLEYDDIKKLGSVKCKRLIVFTQKQYPEFDYAFQLKRYENEDKVGGFAVRDLDGFREFEKAFDYVNWLNGESYYEIFNNK